MLDEKDKKIVETLRNNARLSTQEIGKKTGIPITTVYNRMRRLQKSGVIKGYTVVIDNKKLGRPISAYVLVSVDYKQLKLIRMTEQELAKKIKAHASVDSVSIITGGNDMVAKVCVESVDQLDQFINRYLRSMDGVDKTETMIVLAEV